MTELLTWIDPIGNQTDLDLAADQTGFLILPGRSGFFMPPIDLQEQYVPLANGSIIRYTTAKPRDVAFLLEISGVDAASFLARYRAFCRSVYSGTRQQPGILRNVAADNTSRDLNCYYLDGLEGNEAEETYFGAAMVCPTIWHAGDPFFYDSQTTIVTVTPGGAVSFFPSLVPVRLSPSGIASGFDVYNAGDVEAYPLIVIHGPGTNPSLANTYVGANGVTVTDTMSFTITLGSSDILTIDTTPGIATVTKQDGSNQFSTLDPASPLWNLAPGNNHIQATMGSTGAGSQFQFQYKQRYLTV